MDSRGGNGAYSLFLKARSNGTDISRLFIVDGIISLPVCLAGFVFLPDVPEVSRAWCLTKEVSKHDSVVGKRQNLTSTAGDRLREETNGTRRPQRARALYQKEIQEDTDLMAYLCLDGCLHVCPGLMLDGVAQDS